ncbi:MAG: hypothetical protein HY362_00570 [Candidatus Aenigmarchaeota archaeon]|nr:hypothetical protein [Candidatus Aenigmarchaeota archaeon]
MKAVVALSVYDKGKRAEWKRLLETVKEWRLLELEVYVSDGGSSKKLIKTIKGLGAVVLGKKHSSIGDGIKDSIREAAKHGDIIIVSEGDKSGKYGFSKNFRKILKPIEQGKADLVIVGRTGPSIKSYPKIQQFTEQKIINSLYLTALRKIPQGTDLSYGPRVFRKELAKYFTNSKCIGWDIMYKPLIKIVKDGWKVAEVKIKMKFLDKEEGKPEFVAYRLKQAEEIIAPLIKK